MSLGIGINVVYRKINDLSMETKLRILISDVRNSEDIFINNEFDVKTDYFIGDGYSLTDLSYISNNLLYYIHCSTELCSIVEKDGLEVNFWINIRDNEYSIGYNNDVTLYSNAHIKNVEDIFEEKINNVYKEYIESTYTNEDKNKFHFFFQYLLSQLKL